MVEKLLLQHQLRIFTDHDDRLKISKSLHEGPVSGGHPGVRRLMDKLRKQYYWKHMAKDATKYVKSCKQCQINKAMPKTREGLQMAPTPQHTFDTVIIDNVGPFVKSNKGNNYAVTIICDLTKYLVTIPIRQGR